MGALLSSCASSWYCYVDSIGRETEAKAYFIENHFPEDVNALWAAEYIEDLDVVLQDLGYIKTDSINASLYISFGYSIGEIQEHQYNVSYPVYAYSPSTQTKGSTNTTVKSSTGQTIGTISSKTTSKQAAGTTVAGVGSSTTYLSKQHIEIAITAQEAGTTNVMWAVRITDNTDPSDLENLRKWMPYYLLCAYPYIGYSSPGRVETKVKLKDKRMSLFSHGLR